MSAESLSVFSLPHEGVDGRGVDPVEECLGHPLHHQQDHPLCTAAAHHQQQLHQADRRQLHFAVRQNCPQAKPSDIYAFYYKIDVSRTATSQQEPPYLFSFKPDSKY